jgi:hypothetical protein
MIFNKLINSIKFKLVKLVSIKTIRGQVLGLTPIIPATWGGEGARD